MANYEVLESKEGYLGTEIRTRVPDKEYKDGWDAIWGSKVADAMTEHDIDAIEQIGNKQD